MLSRRELLRTILTAPPVQQLLQHNGFTRSLEPRLLHVDVPLRALDRRLDGLRIAQVSDLHAGYFMPLTHLQDALRLLEKDPPDVFVMTGDLVDELDMAAPCFELMTRVRAPYGRFFVMGNHDNAAGRDAMVATARGAPGFTTLINEEADISIQGAQVHISGVDFPLVKSNWAFKSHFSTEFVHRSTQRMEHADFRLCLAHHPDNWDDVVPRGAELTLSGHTHGGQIAPVGSVVAERVFKYVYGMYAHGDQKLYVNGGTGHWLPMRVGVPAEVTMLTLRRV